MAVPANTVIASSRTNAREDLQNAIYDISPAETPVVTMAKVTSAYAKYHEWNEDELAAVATNAHIEGADSTADAAAATTRPGQRMQILKKTVSVSGSTEAVKRAGVTGEMAYQLKKRGRELKRDLEKAVTGNQGTTSGSTTTAATMAGLESYITTVEYAGAQGGATTPGYSSGSVGVPVDPTATATLAESMVKALQRSLYDNGSGADCLVVGPFNKQQASQNLTGIATLQRDIGMNQKAAVLATFDVWQGDFGDVKVIPNRFSREQTALLLDADYLQLAYLRPMTTEDLAKTGDSTKKHIICEAGIVPTSTKAHGKIVGLATS